MWGLSVTGMNLPYDPKLKEMLCPKCHGIAEWSEEGLKCTEDDCGYIYYTFSDIDNSFQIELEF